MKLIISIITILLLTTQFTYACGEITPSYSITELVKKLSYKDFPTASDIFAVMRIESSMNPNAVNNNRALPSNGLMQVQNGPMDEKYNITIGVSLLRQYFLLSGSKMGAVKSYNVGPYNFLKNKFKKSSKNYYDKFLLQKIVYIHYPYGPLTYLGKYVGCGKKNSIEYYKVDN